MPGKVCIVGVGPGSPDWLTIKARDAITRSDFIAGYKHTLRTVSKIVDGKDLVELTLRTQVEKISEIKRRVEAGKSCAFTCTGDPMFSDSEFVDRIVSNFPHAEIIPGISSIQVASAMLNLPLDKTEIMTFHVSGDVAARKRELLQKVQEGRVVLLLPRPWDFMPDSVAKFLISEGVSGETEVHIIENISLENQRFHSEKLEDITDSKFGDLSIMVIGKRK